MTDLLEAETRVQAAHDRLHNAQRAVTAASVELVDAQRALVTAEQETNSFYADGNLVAIEVKPDLEWLTSIVGDRPSLWRRIGLARLARRKANQ